MEIYQYVLESDGQLWVQRVRWDHDFHAFAGVGAPRRTDSLPEHSLQLLPTALEDWDAVTDGERAVESWLAGE